jgi:hypothetical protein
MELRRIGLITVSLLSAWTVTLAQTNTEQNHPDFGNRQQQHSWSQNRPEQHGFHGNRANSEQNAPFRRPPLLDERFPKMLELGTLPKDQLQKRMDEWAKQRNLPPERRQQMETRIERFRQRIRSEAMQSANKMGVKVPPNRENEFIQSYWQHKIETEKRLNEQQEPLREQLMQESQRQLRQEFEQQQKQGQ